MNSHYPGSELELFATAVRWKAYFARKLKPFIGANVLEVGAGIGSNISYLHSQSVCAWTSLEPDIRLASRITEQINLGKLPPNCCVITGTIDTLAPSLCFDTILYLDVLEHIEDDKRELACAAPRLGTNGHLIVLAPAHQSLYAPFDEAIGHFRRYDMGTLTALTPPGCALIKCFMLDSAGLLASGANRFILSSAAPSHSQIAFWDRILVPISTVLDRLAGYRVGKSVVAIWKKDGELTDAAASTASAVRPSTNGRPSTAASRYRTPSDFGPLRMRTAS